MSSPKSLSIEIGKESNEAGKKQHMSYHHGITIREYRIANKMTLEKLASKWPSKEIGVNIRYVIDVEAGRKRLTAMETPPKLASLLDIPLWKLGLSGYNPFDEEAIKTQPFINMNSLSGLIEDIWY